MNAYTIDKPTEPGWYWCKTPNGKIRASEIVGDSLIGNLAIVTSTGNYSLTLVVGCLWAGPIEEPQ